MTDSNDIELMLSIVVNPVRRRIIRRLSQEPTYPLELSKELGLGQQLVSSHLNIMERAGVVGSLVESSPVGPSRKIYFMKKSVYLSVGFGPHLYSEQTLAFDTIPSGISEEAKRFIAKIKTIQKHKEKTKIDAISDLMSEIDTELSDKLAEKAVLLYIRSLAMKQACELMEKTDRTHDEKRVLHYIIDVRNKNVENIAAALNLRESAIRNILQTIKKELPDV